MSFDIFDEQYYLDNNPDVAAAIANGAISSGLSHFVQLGLNEGRTQISSLYDEATFLQLNPDIAAAVNTDIFSSGLQYWILTGEAEGRFGRTGLYNEAAYLQANPDVAAAVTAGALPSGLAHFAQQVLPDTAVESRWNALYNEPFYLAQNPDVAAAVAAGSIDSGIAHFVSFGIAEGRDGAPYTAFNERLYLFLNPDVAQAVSAGSFQSGLEHYGRFGQAEGRSGGYFNENLYRIDHPDVANAIIKGDFASGAEHYLKFGQYESERSAYFTGSSRSDTVESFGPRPVLSGVAVVDFDFFTGQLTTGSVGTGEVDVLVAANDGADTVFLGNATKGDVLYVGNGGSDYAIVRNFNPESDRLLLAQEFDQYVQLVTSGSLNLFYKNDLVAIIEGVNVPLAVSGELPGGFFLGAEGSVGLF